MFWILIKTKFSSIELSVVKWLGIGLHMGDYKNPLEVMH